MPREKAHGMAAAAAAASRPAGMHRHKQKNRNSGTGIAKALVVAELVAKPTAPKLKYKNSYWEFQENKEKKKKLEFQVTDDKTPPAGFTFVPVGNPELTKMCKELSREEDALIFIVSATKEQNHNIVEHVHRIGYHFRSYIVDQSALALGGLHTISGNGEPVLSLTGDAIPDTQEEINKQADAAIRDLYPRIPNPDREMIIQHAFQKGAVFHGKPVVGLQPQLTLSRRVQLAVIAHIRHTHTRYDQLLRETDYLNARRTVESLCLDILLKWRGDEETGRDQLDEVLREVVVISESESEDEGSGSDDEDEEEEEESVSSDDEVQFLRQNKIAPVARAKTFPVRPGTKSNNKPMYRRNDWDDPRNQTQPGPVSGIANRTRSKTKPKRAVQNKAKHARRGFKRYQAWEEAQKRRQGQARNENPRSPTQQVMRTDSRQLNRSPQVRQEAQIPRRDEGPRREGFVRRDDHPRIDESRPAYEERPTFVRRNIMDAIPGRPHYEHIPLDAIHVNQYGEQVILRSQASDAHGYVHPSRDPCATRTPPSATTSQYPLPGFRPEPHRASPRGAQDSVLPSIEPVDMTGDSPDAKPIRRLIRVPSDHPSNQVMYQQREHEPAMYQTLPPRSNIVYIDEADGQPKRRRILVDPNQPGPSHHRDDEYVRVMREPYPEQRLMATSSMPVGYEINPRDRTVRARPDDDMRHAGTGTADHASALSRLSLYDEPPKRYSDHPQQVEVQAHKRQRTIDYTSEGYSRPMPGPPGPHNIRQNDRNQPPGLVLVEHPPSQGYLHMVSQNSSLSRPSRSDQASHYPSAIPRSQTEYQSQVPASSYGNIPAGSMRPSQFSGDSYREIPQRRILRQEDLSARDDGRGHQLGQPRYIQLPPQQGLAGEVVRVSDPRAPMSNGPRIYPQNALRPGEIIILD